MMKKNIKYMKKIKDIAKHACYCYKTLCFAFQIHLAFKLYFKKKIQIIKKQKILYLYVIYVGKKLIMANN